MAAVAHSPEFAAKVDIPQSVGREFTKDEVPRAAGIIFVAPDGAVLLLCRSTQEANFGGHWALPGGKGEPDETPWQTASREADEEIGVAGRQAWLGEPTVVEEVETPTGMIFTTFVQPVRYRFVPEIDAEHCGYVWSTAGHWPEPMHPQVVRVLSQLFPEGEVQAQDSIALDRATVRTIDADGHLHVERTPISKAVVNPYYGREIPDFERLGLDPEHIYRLYRDPKELARAASSFEGKPLLIRHKPVNADDHPKELTVGTIGSPVSFDAPYLTAPLTVWDGKAIELIETDEQRELSAGYRYRPDMTPGTTPDGEAFDGTMRDIGGNHLALVEQGRAGPDVLVQDSALTPRPMENITMATSPKAKARAARVAAFKTALDGKLAADANIDEVIKTLIAQDEMEPRGEDEEHEDKKAEDEEEDEKAKGAKDDGEEVAEDEDDEDDKEEKVSKSAMDEAIRTSAEAVEKRVRKQFNDIRIAEDEVRPYVGKIAVACDSADKVYRHALDAMKIDIAGLHPSAYRSLLKALPVPSTSAAPVTTAMDAAAQDAYSQRFPNAGRLK